MNDDTRSRYTRRGALTLMGVGGLAATSKTGAFTQITADRGVTVDVSSDENAALRIVGSGQDKQGQNKIDSLEDSPKFFTGDETGVKILITNNFDKKIIRDDIIIRVRNKGPNASLEVSSKTFKPRETDLETKEEVELDNQNPIKPGKKETALTITSSDNPNVDVEFELVSASVNGITIRNAVRTFRIKGGDGDGDGDGEETERRRRGDGEETGTETD